MVNMAQLIYTAMLSFAKSALVQDRGTPATLLCLYRVSALFLVEVATKVLGTWSSEEINPEERHY